MSNLELALISIVFVFGTGILLWVLEILVRRLWRSWGKENDQEPVMIRGKDEPKRLALIYHRGFAAEFNPDRDWAERWCIFSRYLDEEGVFYTDSGENAEELLRFFAGPEEGGQG